MPGEKIDEFRGEVYRILDSMTCRCIPTLRKRLTEVVKTYNPKRNKANTCSKHWWFNFLERNPDIREKWEALPVERTLRKLIRAQRNQNIFSVSSAHSTDGESLQISPAYREEEEEKSPSLQMEVIELDVNNIDGFFYLQNMDFDIDSIGQLANEGMNVETDGIDQYFADWNDSFSQSQLSPSWFKEY